MKNGKQQYKCKQCLRQFIGGNRISANEIWQSYTVGKQTAKQLAQAYKCSRRTILRRLEEAVAQAAANIRFAAPEKANVVMDTTYFGTDFGVMVLYDSISKQTLSVRIVDYETNALYLASLNEIIEKGVFIQSIICDGRKGLTGLLPNTPVQLCQFHQVKTVTTYLTRNPKSAAGQDLKQLVLTLKSSSKADFIAALNEWHTHHKSYLNERSINPETGKSSYTHKKLRSAYRSLKNNLPYLFTFEDYADLNIPKTTNLLEGKFSDMKGFLRCHQGLSRGNKIQFIKDYFSI